MGPDAHFYYELGDPDCYLVAERILGMLPVVAEWEPVLGAAIGIRPADPPDRDRVAARAAELGLLPLRWPPAWPPDTELAARAATFAKRAGKTVAFSQAAFRQSFAGGNDLGLESTVLIAAAACEIHPTALLKGVGLRSISRALAEAGDRARAAGVRTLPSIVIGGEVYAGEGCPERLVDALGSAA